PSTTCANTVMPTSCASAAAPSPTYRTGSSPAFRGPSSVPTTSPWSRTTPPSSAAAHAASSARFIRGRRRPRTSGMRIDIDTYKRRAGRLDLDGLDFDTFRSQPLEAGTLRCLRYMHDIEHHTVCYLRDLLATPAHQDPDVTAFLTIWNFEEFWHGDAIARVLAAHDEAAGQGRIGPLRRSLRWTDRLRPPLHALGSSVVGSSYTAVHMTWGAINEWTTQAGYARLAARAGHPTLTELVRRIMRQEGRHVDFYASQAQRRLARDSRAQRVTR